MDPDVVFKKTSRSSFCAPRKLECSSSTEARSNTSEDEIPDELKHIIARITLPNMDLYERHTQKLIAEEEEIKSKYHRAKLAFSLSEKINRKTTYVSSVECEQFLTDKDKSFLQKRPDYLQTDKQMNLLINEITLLVHKKCSAMKTSKNCRTLLANRIRALKNSVGKHILESNDLDIGSSDEENDVSCFEEVLTDSNV